MSDRKKVSDVFGVSPDLRPDSYVDRGELDARVGRLLGRTKHVFLRGESKCGKSWLRQRVLPDALVTRCRHNTTCIDLYSQALGQLGIDLVVDQRRGSQIKGRVEAKAGAGLGLLAKLGLGASIEAGGDRAETTRPVGRDISDLNFIASLLKASARRLVIEDVHYLSADEREVLAYDLKALWDESVFVVIAGVWSDQSMLVTLNPELNQRVAEVEVTWTEPDLRAVLEAGGRALRLSFSDAVKNAAVKDAYGNVGILQDLAVELCDEVGIQEQQDEIVEVGDLAALEAAAMAYADGINPVYQRFAERVSGGIRKRESATNIYAYALAAIMEAEDDELIEGVPLDTIFRKSAARQPRIQKPNLHSALSHIADLQVNDKGVGLVLAYNETERFVHVIDRQLLVYRKYMTKPWPFEELIAEAEASAAAEREAPIV